jgi:hypothetical protein
MLSILRNWPEIEKASTNDYQIKSPNIGIN